MHSWEALDPNAFQSKGAITSAYLQLGKQDFRPAGQYVSWCELSGMDSESDIARVGRKGFRKGDSMRRLRSLFSSDTKFESGTGWPSFWDPIAKENVRSTNDDSLGMSRTAAKGRPNSRQEGA